MDGVGHVSVGLTGEQVHHAGGETMIHEQHRGLKIDLKKVSGVLLVLIAAHLGLSSVASRFTKDRKSLQKFIQTVGFQQLCSFCQEEKHKTEKVQIL